MENPTENQIEIINDLLDPEEIFEIRYACNPDAYFASLSREDRWTFIIRRAELYCTRCYTRVDFTKKNMKTLPASLFVNGLDQTTFDNSPVFGGQCLRRGCR
jgi:hypothetical protein